MKPHEILIPRGVRNNNPLNIRAVVGQLWRGQVGIDPDNFVIFADPVYGFRAGLEILTNYFHKDGRTTLEEVITRWAPPHTNDTAAYIHAVCAVTGFTPMQTIVALAERVELCSAMTRQECGDQFYTHTTIELAARLYQEEQWPSPTPKITS